MIRLATLSCLTLFCIVLGCLSASAPVRAQEMADLVVRLSRLEGQVRQLSGQVEQLQFDNRQLKDTLRKFQEDVDFRFQERNGGRAAGPSTTQPSTSPPASGSDRTRPGRRSDAFDPSGNPDAPGAPRRLGSATPAGPGAAASADIPRGALPEGGEARPRPGAPLELDDAARGAAPSGRPDTSIAATGSGDPRADYDAAYAYLMQRHYDDAEMAFRRFLQSHPRDRLVPDATYWLGESYLHRNKPRDAAEQFLKVSTDYTRSPKAPEALLKLGVALSALGAHDQACATFAQLERKYPQAGPVVRQGVEREQKRARCPA